MTPTGGSLDPRGPVAEAIADLWWLMLILGVIVFVLFLVLLIRGLTRRVDPGSEVVSRHERLVARWIGLGGVAIPTVVIVVVFGATLGAMRAVPDGDRDDALTIEVTGHQFWYEVRYPESGFVTANELHLPTGRPISLRLSSEDVIHSFWVPELGGKLDMLPERTNTLVLQADEPGEYRSRCAEFCGLQHARMALVVVAEPPDRFEAWVADRLAIAEPEDARALEGREVYIGSGCATCHAFRGGAAAGLPGPDLTTLPDRPTIGAMPLANTPDNLVAWIRDPQSIKPGVEMPATELTDAEVDALLAYLGIRR